MLRHKKYLIFIIIIGIQLMFSFQYISIDSNMISDDLNDISEKNPLDQRLKINNKNIKSNPLVTNTNYTGETIHLHLTNGSNPILVSNYTYNELNNITHYIFIHIDFPFAPSEPGKQIQVHVPLFWNYTSITPSESVIFNNNHYAWEFNFTQGSDTDYIMIFNSGLDYGIDSTQKEVNNPYYTYIDSTIIDNNDFEESSLIDWVNDTTKPFEEISYNNTYFSNASQSLEFNDTDTNEDIFGFNTTNPFDLGKYLITFRILTLNVSGNLNFKYYSSGGVISNAINTTSQVYDIWQKYTIEINLDIEDSLEYPFYFSLDGNGTFYLDQINCWNNSIDLSNTNTQDQYNMTLYYSSIDLYQSFGCNNLNLSIYLKNRNLNTTLDSDYGYTNTYGFYNTTYTNLTEIEYEVMVSNTNVTPVEGATAPDYSNQLLFLELDEGTGTDIEDSTDNHDGVLYNTPTWSAITPDNSSYCLEFSSSSNEYFYIGDYNEYSFTDGNDLPFSISAWIKIKASGSYQSIISKYGGNGKREWAFVYDGTVCKFFICDTSASNYIEGKSFNPDINQWIHVVGTYNGNETFDGIDFYINGQLNVSDRRGNGVYNGMTNTAQQVESRVNSALYPNMFMDRIQVWDKELSSSEVLTLYNERYTIPETTISTYSYAYFQPYSIIMRDYISENIDYNKWDFKESSEESIDWEVINTASYNFSNGYMLIDFANNQGTEELYPMNAFYTSKYDDSINTSYYNYLAIRLRATEDIQIRFYPTKTDDTGFFLNSLSSIVLNQDNWTTFYFDLNSFSLNRWDSVAILKNIEILISDYPFSNFEGDELLYVDFISLYHNNTPVFKQSDSEYWLTSVNNSMTHNISYLETTSSTYTDNTHITKTKRGSYLFNYTSYIDSNYVSGLYLPYTSYDRVLHPSFIKPSRSIGSFIIIVAEGLFYFGILAFSVLFLFKMFIKLTKN